MKFIAVLSLFISSIVFAAPGAPSPDTVQDDGIPFGAPLTPEQMVSLTQKISDVPRRDALLNLVQVCNRKEYTVCQVAFYDLVNYGLVKSQDLATGNWVSNFGTDVRANRVYDGVIGMMSHPDHAPSFNISTKAAFEEFGVPPTLDIFQAIQSPATKEAALRMIENNFRARSVPVNMRLFIGKKRGEYIRLLAYGHALRGDSVNSYKSLELLQKYGKMDRKDAWVVRHTYDSVVKLMSALAAEKQKAKAQSKVKKPVDQVQSIQF